MDLTTPALLFPGISLLFLAYNARFMTLANLIRSLHKEYLQEPHKKLQEEMDNLRLRLRLIRAMQSSGVLSFLLCIVAMCGLLLGSESAGEAIFGASLLALGVSLAVALYEIRLSIKALEIHISAMEEPKVSE